MRVTSLREIREVLTHPSIYQWMTDEPYPKDWTPDPSAIYFRLGKGLVFYELHGTSAEMHTALFPGDVKGATKSDLYAQWAEIKSMGVNRIYAVCQNLRARIMCRAVGMNKRPSEKVHIYEVSI